MKEKSATNKAEYCANSLTIVDYLGIKLYDKKFNPNNLDSILTWEIDKEQQTEVLQNKFQTKYEQYQMIPGYKSEEKHDNPYLFDESQQVIHINSRIPSNIKIKEILNKKIIIGNDIKDQIKVCFAF